MDWKNADAAKKYKPGEAITGPIALHLIRQCGLDRADGTEDLVVLDNACGTGVVTLGLYETLSPAAKERLEVVCGDFSPAMVESVQARIEESGWKGAQGKVVDAQKMDLPSGYFTHAITNFALIPIPNPRACLAETFRVLRPGGTAAFSIWQSVGWYPIAVGTLARIPEAPPVPSFSDYSTVFLKDRGAGGDRWTERTCFEGGLREAGFEEIQTVLHSMVTTYQSVDQWEQTFSAVTFSMIKPLWSDEESAKIAPQFAAALKDELRERFGSGEVKLHWEAWCVTARKPAA